MNKAMNNETKNYVLTLAAGIGVSAASILLLEKVIPSKNIVARMEKVVVTSALTTVVMNKVYDKLDQ